MKTPQQIADELQQATPMDMTERAMLVAAIEADRAQRGRFDKIAADRAEEAAISVNAVLMAEQDGFTALSDHDKILLTRAREHMTVIAADLRDEDDA